MYTSYGTLKKKATTVSKIGVDKYKIKHYTYKNWKRNKIALKLDPCYNNIIRI